MSRCVLMIPLAFVATLSNATTSWATTPAVTAMRFIPLVVPETYALPVTFEATTTGSPASVAFAYDGVDRAMFDNGTNGDRVAGDGVWTIQFLPSEIIGKVTAASVYRPFIGFCKPAGGGTFNVFAEVWTSAIGLASVQARTSTVQQTDHVVNIVESAVELQAFDTTVMTKHFYAVYPDAYDFLNIVSVRGEVANRHHESASNAVSGLGQMLFNNTATYWSAGRLKGVTVYPIPTLFDGASTTFSHETGHQWMVFLSGPLWASGVPHWPKGDVAGNVMGFSVAGPGGEGGDFHYTFTPNGMGGYVVGNSPDSVSRAFNSIELYLMGLIPTAQVGTFFVLNDQTITPVAGQTVQASQVTTFDVNTVIAANGARVPDSASSQKIFRSATVVYSDQLLDSYAMSLFDWFARRADQTMLLTCAEGFAQYSCQPFFLGDGRARHHGVHDSGTVRRRPDRGQRHPDSRGAHHRPADAHRPGAAAVQPAALHLRRLNPHDRHDDHPTVAHPRSASRPGGCLQRRGVGLADLRGHPGERRPNSSNARPATQDRAR